MRGGGTTVAATSAYFLALLRGMLQGGATSALVADVVPEPAAVGGTHHPAVTLPTDRVEADRLEDGPAEDRPDADSAEWLTWLPLAALTVVLGVAPGLLLSPVAEAAAAYLGGLR